MAATAMDANVADREARDRDVPAIWSDLKHPRYKGMMVMPDPSFTAIQLVVVGMLSRALGWDYYKALRANDTMIVQGHQQVFSAMQQGERVCRDFSVAVRALAKFGGFCYICGIRSFAHGNHERIAA
jgi:ABC-type Fe3+ transport system substrate-binding protein